MEKHIDAILARAMELSNGSMDEQRVREELEFLVRSYQSGGSKGVSKHLDQKLKVLQTRTTVALQELEDMV